MAANSEPPVRSPYPVTPDGRYFVVRGRLWRCANPSLLPEDRAAFVHRLMIARRLKGAAMRKGDEDAKRKAMLEVQAAKVGSGERGPVWWKDNLKDWNRHLAKNTPYADWFASTQHEAPRAASM